MRRFVLLVLVFNVCLFGISAWVLSAQDDDRPTPIDVYPVAGGKSAFGQKHRFVASDRWNKTNLTYFFHNCPSTLDCNQAHNAMRQAFAKWDSVSGLVFSESNSAGNADIEVTFSASDSDFAGDSDVLAYAYFPSSGGDMVFNDKLQWSLFDGGSADLYVITLHELGHSLGLDHSVEGTVMYAYSGGNVMDLTPDDIQGIQSLYGADNGDTAPSNPDNTDTAPPVIATPDDWTQTENTPENADGGFLDANQDYEGWELEVVAGETVTVIMQATSGDIDPYLLLVSDDWETILTEDDNGAGDSNARLSYTFDSDGTFVVIATMVDPETAGEYELSFSFEESTGEDNTDTSFDNADGEATPATLTLYNQSGFDICAVYFALSTDAEWSDDQLGQVLADGDGVIWDVPSGQYDVSVEDCEGNYIDEYGIDVYGNAEITVTAEGIVH
jgi:hypothetical protein